MRALRQIYEKKGGEAVNQVQDETTSLWCGGSTEFQAIKASLTSPPCMFGQAVCPPPPDSNWPR
jgi:hypothetical protein